MKKNKLNKLRILKVLKNIFEKYSDWCGDSLYNFIASEQKMVPHFSSYLINQNIVLKKPKTPDDPLYLSGRRSNYKANADFNDMHEMIAEEFLIFYRTRILEYYNTSQKKKKEHMKESKKGERINMEETKKKIETNMEETRPVNEPFLNPQEKVIVIRALVKCDCSDNLIRKIISL